MSNKSIEMNSYIIDNLERAKEEGWIRVYYQPVIRTLSREMCGMEALARWQDPEHGLLSPAVFIPALESAGRIHELDVFMLKQICRDFRDDFKKNKFMVPVSMNLSRADFINTDIFGHIIRTVGEYAVPRDLLHLEITESMLGSEGDFMVKHRAHEREVIRKRGGWAEGGIAEGCQQVGHEVDLADNQPLGHASQSCTQARRWL